MDTMLQLRLVALGGILAMYGLALGMSIALGRLIRRRERHQTTLRAAVAQQVPLEIRDRIEAQVRCAYFGHKSLVRIIMGSCSAREVWGTITRLSEGLSPGVRILVCVCPIPPYHTITR